MLKTILSIFLLLIYSIGFAHNVIPHHHSYEVEEHLLNHQHVNVVDLDEDDILHESHLDDSFVDYVLCLLSEIKHPSSYHVDHHFISFPKEDASSKVFISKAIVVSAIILEKPSPNQSFTLVRTPYFTNYLSANTTSSPFRGPPFYFC